jgi:hypothetical protein
VEKARDTRTITLWIRKAMIGQPNDFRRVRLLTLLLGSLVPVSHFIKFIVEENKLNQELNIPYLQASTSVI